MLKDRMKRLNVIGEIALYVAAGLLFGCIFFRQIIFSNFDLLLGDVGDARFNGVILEHWWQVVRGDASWRSPVFFFPVQGVLGYSDAGFLNALPHVVLRFMGIDPFTSHQIVLFGLTAAGWIGSILFLRCCLKLRIFPVIVGAVLFVFPNAMANSMMHTQLLTVYLIPYLAIGLYLFFTNFEKAAWIRRLAGICLAILVPSIFYTSFYIGWFFLFYILLLTGIYAVWCIACSGIKTVWLSILWNRKVWRTLWPYGVLCGVGFIPFLITYVPVLMQFGRRAYHDVIPTLPSLADYVNISPGNWMWGKTFSTTFAELGTRLMAHELIKGLPFFSMFIFLLFLVFFIHQLRHYHLTVTQTGCCQVMSTGNRPDAEGFLTALAFGHGITVLLSWLLMLKTHGISLWWLVFNLVPGAGSIRAVFRFQHVLAFPIALVTAIGLHQFMNRVARQRWALRTKGAVLFLLMGVCGLLVVEQFNLRNIANCSKRQQQEMLTGIRIPPQQAEVFAVLPNEASRKFFFEAQIDAMIIAQRYGLKTINGYSGLIPAGWEGMLALKNPAYSVYLLRWIVHHHLENTGLFLLDCKTGEWLAADEWVRNTGITLMGGPLEDSDFALTLSSEKAPTRWRASEIRTYFLRLKNNAEVALSGCGSDIRSPGKYTVHLSYRWIQADSSTPLSGFDNRTALSSTIGPGMEIVQKMEIESPAKPGKYWLEIEAVQEQIAWFKDKGSPGLRLEVDVKESLDPSSVPVATIEFKEKSWPGIISKVTGLSGAEPWGAWSEGDKVTFEFTEPLPEEFTVRLVACAFGPNVGKEFIAYAGAEAVQFNLASLPEERALEFSNPTKSRTLTITIPAPVSPAELELSADNRKLGIGFNVLSIVSQ